MNWLTAYGALFLSSFIAATLLPAASEVGLAALSTQSGANLFLLWLVATLGNTLGALVNWILGRFLYHHRDHRFFPFKQKTIEKASSWFQRFGVWSLLFAWVPIIGDPLTFVAGLLRTRFEIFLILTAIGKGARYAVVLALAANFM